MAVDMFLFIDTPAVPGESQSGTKAHAKGCIDVLAWSWGVSNSGTTHMGGGSGAGKANFQDLSVTSWYEKSTHELMKSCSKGTHHGEITLVCRKAGDKPLEYINYILKDCIITSVSTGGSGGEDRLTVNFSINFGAFDIKYVEQDKKGGTASEVPFAFDIAANEVA
ncbi:Hcp family type VI secretion system effector [Loktanella sp. M215]|uniref:Hcp family type VI secretion system effector n=1 Tax=Loktanella sp. M215 TaxID=2675431 RepID=UPI001F15D1D9|nr:type VI secretion system tube protein Hcp [Loktanella sp. M215]MCF7699892.1 type VI secretion system tube protein Hcp [Loktanella sp. M215]